MFIYTKYAEHPPCPLKRSLLSILRSRLHKHHLTFSHAISVNLIKFITLIRPKLKLICIHTSLMISQRYSRTPTPATPQTNTFFWILSYHVHVLSLHLNHICPLFYTGKRYIKFIYLYFDHKMFFPSPPFLFLFYPFSLLSSTKAI